MKLKTGTQIIIADSEKYLLLYNQGDEDIIDLRVLDSEVRDNPPDREQAADKPGRLHSPNAQISSVGQTDWHEYAKALAASDLAEKVNALDSDMTPIILVADAKTLGLVKPQLNVRLTNKLIASIPKDLTHHTIPDIEKIILAA